MGAMLAVRPMASASGGKAAAAAAAAASGKRKEDLRQDDSKYRQMVSVLYPKDARPAKLPLPPAEELERRAVLAKVWSRHTVRQAHVHGNEIHRFIAARQEARRQLLAVYPEAVAAADAKAAAESDTPFPVERRMPTNTPALPPTARR